MPADRRHSGLDTGFDAVVVGAGIAGIAAAHALVAGGLGRVAIIESGPPLGLTSDKSTECYRNFWPGPDDAMASFMGHSIDLLVDHAQRSGDRFTMRQQGYLFATARHEEIARLARQAAEVARYGAGPLRHHTTSECAAYPPSPGAALDATLDGTDLVTDAAAIRRHFPYLAPDTLGVLHVRKCGALSAQQLGMYLLEDARERGARLIPGDFIGITTTAGRLAEVVVRTGAGDGGGAGEITLQTPILVLAPGPHLSSAARLAGTDLAVLVEQHVKISLADTAGVIPRDAPLVIWNDPIDLAWTDEEREMLAAAPETRHLLETFPAGVHGRPVGAGDQVLMYWTYDCAAHQTPVFPIAPDPVLPEITLRGMARMIPGLTRYFDPMPKPYVDGGYYTKAADNRPLIGPLDVPGTFVSGAYSGYGIMAAMAGGALLADHVLARPLPAYGPAFLPTRLEDAAYLARITGAALTAQL